MSYIQSIVNNKTGKTLPDLFPTSFKYYDDSYEPYTEVLGFIPNVRYCIPFMIKDKGVAFSMREVHDHSDYTVELLNVDSISVYRGGRFFNYEIYDTDILINASKYVDTNDLSFKLDETIPVLDKDIIDCKTFIKHYCFNYWNMNKETPNYFISNDKEDKTSTVSVLVIDLTVSIGMSTNISSQAAFEDYSEFCSEVPINYITNILYNGKSLKSIDLLCKINQDTGYLELVDNTYKSSIIMCAGVDGSKAIALMDLLNGDDFWYNDNVAFLGRNIGGFIQTEDIDNFVFQLTLEVLDQKIIKQMITRRLFG